MGYPGPSPEVTSRARKKNLKNGGSGKEDEILCFFIGFRLIFQGCFLLKPWEGIPWNIATTFFWNTKKWEVIVRISSCLV